MKKILVRTYKITGIFLAFLLLILLALNFFFEKMFNEQVKLYANNHLKSKLDFSDTRLSFFSHFPTLTLSLYDFSLGGASPFEKDTLISSKEIALGVDLSSLFTGDMKINKILVTDASIKVMVNERGEASYDIYQAAGKDSVSQEQAEDETALKIENILFENTSIYYEDQSIPVLIKAKGLNYNGKGDLSQSIFDLASQVSIDSFDFNFDNQYYFVSKKIQAELLTKINTHSLSFVFAKNDLKINELPVRFTGLFEFLKNGYNMSFDVNADASDLKYLVTALPQEYIQWLNKTDLQGSGNIKIKLAGKYIAETETSPDLSLTASIRNGYIANEKAPSPLRNLYLDFETKVSGLNPDELTVNVDSLSFNLDEGYFGANLKLKGLDKYDIKTSVNTEIDLGKLKRAVGFKAFDIKGKYGLHLNAEVLFVQEQNPNSVDPDTMITCIPSFQVQSSLSDGYFKYTALEQPLQDISFVLNANCPNHDYRNASISLENLNARFLKNELEGYLKVNGGKQVKVDANLNGLVRLSTLKKIYPIDSLELKGDLQLKIITKGAVDIDKDIFPNTNAEISLTDGLVKTKYYPKPVEKINIDAIVKSTGGSLKNTHVILKPVSFNFEDQPVYLKLNLLNFDNLRYDITSKGSIDLGHLCKIFSPDGFRINGFIKTDFSMRGLQSDAENGYYEKLQNSGSFMLQNIDAESDYFPLPFHINTGTFLFRQDALDMRDLSVKYGDADFQLEGSVSNMLNYFLGDGTLKGNLSVKSNFLNVDQFMSGKKEGDTLLNNPAKSNDAKSNEAISTGVVEIPQNLDLDFKADFKKIKFDNLTIKDAKANLSVRNGILKINESGFSLIDAPVVMNATYQSIHPTKAYFDYHINAKEFDIKRAYHEVDIFHDLVSAAANAQGIVSLDYSLKGMLNAQMDPVMPTLEGEGTLSVLKAKIKGYKLFTAISKASSKDSLNNANLSNVEIKTAIKKNIITLLPLKMKIAGFYPKIKGETTFDGKLNLKFRLGLPPLGIVGIPFNVTGTNEKPIVKLGKGKNNESLKETEQEDW